MRRVQRSELLRTTSVLLVVALVVGAGVSALRDTLYRPTFLTGWVLGGLVLFAAGLWWSPPKELEAFTTRTRRHLLLALGILATFLIHVDLRLPLGWVETTLFCLFIAYLASTLVGAVLARERRNPQELERRVGRWLRIHGMLVWSLLALGVFHGAFVHLHGWMAHVFLYGEGTP